MKWKIESALLESYYGELQVSGDFLSSLNAAISPVREFAGVQFRHVDELRVYRSLLYLFTRAFRPEVFVETGVLNGFSSAFILLAMHRNGTGTLYSIDLPPLEERILDQGTNPLPVGRQPGWAIPSYLRSRHCLHLGDAKVLLPRILDGLRRLDAFLHDSDHSYGHMMFELSLAWRYLRAGGWLLCDNVEQNDAFLDFTRGVGGHGFELASFDVPARRWKHGLIQKASDENAQSGTAHTELKSRPKPCGD
jgi:predicted O-methyltransferase YrrM